MKKKIFIIDDNLTNLRTTLSIVAESSEKLKVVGEYDSGEEGIKDILKKCPDIIVMSVDLPGSNGIEMTQLIRSRFPHIDILLISEYEDHETIFAGLKAGASGYMLRTENYMDFLKAMEEVVDGGAPLSRKVARLVIQELHTNLNSVISKRERQVMQMISAGMTYSEISEALNISKETSRTHIRNIYSKLKVNSKSQAISRAKEERLI